MKKILLLCMLAVSTVSYAQTTISVSTDAIELSDSTGTSLDLSQEIYGDVKTALEGMSEGLGVKAEHVYGVVTKQQRVNSISELIITLFPLLFLFLAIKSLMYVIYCGKNKIDYNDDLHFSVIIFAGLLGLLGLIRSIAFISTIVMGFVNPEYGAMNQIMEWINS